MSTDTRYCPNCGKEVRAGAEFCGDCGARLAPPAPSAQQEQTPPAPPVYTLPPQNYGTQYNPYRPLSVGEYVLTLVLGWIPIVGLILLIVWAFSDENVHRRNFCRACLIVKVIVLILRVVCIVYLLAMIGSTAAVEIFGNQWVTAML